MEKEDGTLRITTNSIRSNQVIPMNRYSIPMIKEILQKLKRYIYFSKIDLKERFFEFLRKRLTDIKSYLESKTNYLNEIKFQ